MLAATEIRSAREAARAKEPESQRYINRQRARGTQQQMIESETWYSASAGGDAKGRFERSGVWVDRAASRYAYCGSLEYSESVALV